MNGLGLKQGLSLYGILFSTFAISFVPNENFLVARPLMLGVSGKVGPLHPLVEQSDTSKTLYFLTQRPLIKIDRNWNWRCDLCVALPSDKDQTLKIVTPTNTKNSNVLETTWMIKPDAIWHDGQPVTGKDIKLGYEIQKKLRRDIQSQTVFDKIEAIEVDPQDPKKFKIRYSEVTPRFSHLMNLYPVPSHLEAKIWKESKENPNEYRRKSHYRTSPNHQGLYNGKFIVKQPKTRGQFTLKAASTSTPSQIIQVIEVSSSSELTKLLKSGAIDVYPEGHMDFATLKKIINSDNKLNKKYTLSQRPGLSYEHVVFNLRNPILADQTVRKALALSINRKWIVRELFSNHVTVANIPINPLDQIFTRPKKKASFNPSKAVELLKQSGWQLKKDGWRYKSGKKLSLQLHSTKGNKTRNTIAAKIKKDLLDIGVELTYTQQPSTIFFGETVRKSRFPGLALFAWKLLPGDLPGSTLHSREIPTWENSYTGQNVGNWLNTKVDKNITLLQSEFQAENRANLVSEIMDEFLEETPAIPLFFYPNAALVSKQLKGFTVSGHLYPSTINADEWQLLPDAS